VLRDRPPENNPFYSSIDIMPELRLARRKSMTLVSDLVSQDIRILHSLFLSCFFWSKIKCLCTYKFYMYICYLMLNIQVYFVIHTYVIIVH